MNVDNQTATILFESSDENHNLPPVQIPLSCTPAQLHTLLLQLLPKNSETARQPLSFYHKNTEILHTLRTACQTENSSVETTLVVKYVPRVIYRVSPVTRCSSSLPGHTAPILSVNFSPSGDHVATGSGDNTIRIWKTTCEMPVATLTGHNSWVLAVAWSPDGNFLASGGNNGSVIIWRKDGDKFAAVHCSAKHKKRVTSLSWEPLHMRGNSIRLCSASEDGMIRVWNSTGACEKIFSGHGVGVNAVLWGGRGLIYSGGKDRSVHVWKTNGQIAHILKGHAHWVNSLTVNTEHALRTGADEATYRRVLAELGGEEVLVSCSDDFTLFVWTPESSNKAVERLTGHQQPVNVVKFSPNGRCVASVSFDNNCKIWKVGRGKESCKFQSNCRGHVQAVYQVGWSVDSSLIVTGSRDSTLKIWDAATGKLAGELAGHADAVFAVDWSPDGRKVVSGGKDMIVKFWKK